MSQKVTNILGDFESASSAQESTSALYHVDAATCPKCKTAMGTATITGGDTVYHCEGCRVSHPMPNLAQ